LIVFEDVPDCAEADEDVFALTELLDEEFAPLTAVCCAYAGTEAKAKATASRLSLMEIFPHCERGG
jgi:hypothetical protein